MAKKHSGVQYDPWRLLKTGALLLLILAVTSTLVYYLLGRYYGRTDWTMEKCLFMVVITLSTIGYGDWLNISGLFWAEVFTMFLALAGIGVPAFIISNITALIVEGVLGDTIRRRRMQQEIAGLARHIIICGAGDTGEHCIGELLKTGRKFVVIERNEPRVHMLRQTLGEFPYVLGDADRDEALLAAGVERAEGLLACLSEDKDNLFTTLSARLLNPNLRVVSKGVEDNVRKKMVQAGAASVVSPTAIGGLRMVSELIRPATVGFLDTMLRERTAVRFSELTVKTGAPLAGSTLASADLLKHADVLVVAARHPGAENFIYNPKADFRLEPDCVLVFLGPATEVEKLRMLFEGSPVLAR